MSFSNACSFHVPVAAKTPVVVAKRPVSPLANSIDLAWGHSQYRPPPPPPPCRRGARKVSAFIRRADRMQPAAESWPLIKVTGSLFVVRPLLCLSAACLGLGSLRLGEWSNACFHHESPWPGNAILRYTAPLTLVHLITGKSPIIQRPDRQKDGACCQLVGGSRGVRSPDPDMHQSRFYSAMCMGMAPEYAFGADIRPEAIPTAMATIIMTSRGMALKPEGRSRCVEF